MDSMNIQWYPGHMTKTRRQMEQDLKLVDAVCELLDARIPISSRNPDIAALCGPKPRLVILNRMDMADPAATRAWCEAFRRESLAAVATDCKSRRGLTAFVPAVRNLLQEKIARNAAKGQNRPLKIMVVGIPNVGKSTFINSYAGKACTKTGNKPGVTKGKQWIKLNKNVELLDTPGILWPKFEDQAVGQKLAISGSIKDDILNITELAMKLADYMSKNYPGTMASRYGIEESDDSVKVLADIAIAKCCLMKGGEPNIDKAASMLIDDFRSLRLGKVTLEQPPQSEEE